LRLHVFLCRGLFFFGGFFFLCEWFFFFFFCFLFFFLSAGCWFLRTLFLSLFLFFERDTPPVYCPSLILFVCRAHIGPAPVRPVFPSLPSHFLLYSLFPLKVIVHRFSALARVPLPFSWVVAFLFAFSIAVGIKRVRSSLRVLDSLSRKRSILDESILSP